MGGFCKEYNDVFFVAYSSVYLKIYMIVYHDHLVKCILRFYCKLYLPRLELCGFKTPYSQTPLHFSRVEFGDNAADKLMKSNRVLCVIRN